MDSRPLDWTWIDAHWSGIDPIGSFGAISREAPIQDHLFPSQKSLISKVKEEFDFQENCLASKTQSFSQVMTSFSLILSQDLNLRTQKAIS